LPWDGIALIESPSDPLGALLRPVDAVRLARACRLVVIDERFSEFGGHSLLGFAREFDNVVILRSFDSWAGLPAYPCGWAVASPGVARLLASGLIGPEPEAMSAAMATLDSAEAMTVTLRLIREERSRLYRSLRKFAAFEPLPSWGPFIAARVGFGLRDEIVAALNARNMVTHAPTEGGLEDYIRFGLGTRSAMEQLYEALRQIMPAIMDDALLIDRADADCLSLGRKEFIETEAGKVE
jgi:histidinol-phosphate/aromatic aminotransferase/cobyric acid decarboxylase-like protein